MGCDCSRASVSSNVSFGGIGGPATLHMPSPRISAKTVALPKSLDQRDSWSTGLVLCAD